ncbi:MAG TPA: gamma-glutamylcyclotransferase [Kofleriaceae bacterium]|nr:gamma-glutamylcyclotransferase [Kofleriaceae bacterium]
MAADQWIFGYGSLIWQPAFEFVEAQPGFVLGWQRRFFQASPDHRGTPEAPGRVVTLVPDARGLCWGMAYRVADGGLAGVLEDLDLREQAGYQRSYLDVHLRDRADGPVRALVYVADPTNANFVEAALPEIAAVVRAARGPSGSNRDYLERLDAALRAMGGRDDHVAALWQLVAG